MELVNTDTKKTISVPFGSPESEIEENIEKMFSVKERCNISNCAYHEMSMISDLYSLSKAAKKTSYNLYSMVYPREN